MATSMTRPRYVPAWRGVAHASVHNVVDRISRVPAQRSGAAVRNGSRNRRPSCWHFPVAWECRRRVTVNFVAVSGVSVLYPWPCRCESVYESTRLFIAIWGMRVRLWWRRCVGSNGCRGSLVLFVRRVFGGLSPRLASLCAVVPRFTAVAVVSVAAWVVRIGCGGARQHVRCGLWSPRLPSQLVSGSGFQ